MCEEAFLSFLVNDDFQKIVLVECCNQCSYWSLIYARQSLTTHLKKFHAIWLVRCDDTTQITHLTIFRKITAKTGESNYWLVHTGQACLYFRIMSLFSGQYPNLKSAADPKIRCATSLKKWRFEIFANFPRCSFYLATCYLLYIIQFVLLIIAVGNLPY